MNPILKIRIYGDSCLRKRSTPVGTVGPGERLFISSMIETMHQSKGIGLAAPQVGLNHQIIVVDVGDGPLVLVNPKILKKRGSAMLEEGCLSIPGVVVDVRRPADIEVEYRDEHNRTVRKFCSELLARVIQHEIDHLHGKLIVDYVGWGHKLRVQKQLREFLKYGKVLHPQKPDRPVPES